MLVVLFSAYISRVLMPLEGRFRSLPNSISSLDYHALIPPGTRIGQIQAAVRSPDIRWLASLGPRSTGRALSSVAAQPWDDRGCHHWTGECEQERGSTEGGHLLGDFEE